METFHRLTLSDLLSLYWDWIPALSLRPVQLLSSRTHKMRLFLSRNERYRTNRTQELSNYDLWFPPPSLMLTNEIRPLPKVSERRVCLFYPLYIEDVRGWRYKKNPFFFVSRLFVSRNLQLDVLNALQHAALCLTVFYSRRALENVGTRDWRCPGARC